MPLAVVLHTHMPYVEGFGTWPFGEEWLWEAMATSYLPLLDVLAGEPALTLSVTPVLADQLAAPGVPDRFRAFVDDVRSETHERDAADARAAGEEAVAAELERSASEYAAARERFDALGGDLLAALAPHAAWTSAATHAVLPLCATHAGVRLQLRAGIDAHRARAARPWRGGLWLPECAHAPWLDPLLEEAGVRAACVDLTEVHGLASPEHLRPLRTEAGPLLVPIDWATVALAWGDGAMPSRAPYRSWERKTRLHHRPWRNDGAPYDAAAASAQARSDAAEFVERVAERLTGGGLCVFAVDTELLGHWWYEGPQWLAAVAEQCRAQGVELVHLDDALERCDPAPCPPDLPVSTWGRGRDLRAWSAPEVADIAWSLRDGELAAVAAARGGLSDEAARALLALQSSDWAFAVSWQRAPSYGFERAALHRGQLDAALAGEPLEGALRGIAAHATAAALREP